MATARCLTEPELELEQYLCIFIRDELISLNTPGRSVPAQVNEKSVVDNAKLIVSRANSLFNYYDHQKVNNIQEYTKLRKILTIILD